VNIEFVRIPQSFSSWRRSRKACAVVRASGTGHRLCWAGHDGEANVPFFLDSGRTSLEMFVGVGAKQRARFVEQRKKERACIIFLDELRESDATARRLGRRQDAREPDPERMLVEMDGVSKSTRRHPDRRIHRQAVLDPAL